MARETLLDFFDDFAALSELFLLHDDGYRSVGFRYVDVAREARAFAARLREQGIGKSDKALIWSENRPGWVMALWGCLHEGVVLVPIDYRASADFMERVRRIVRARLILVGDEVALPPIPAGTAIWRLADFDQPRAGALRPHESEPLEEHRRSDIGRDDIAEIIFTSGATADPKGVMITHRNVLANIVPVEREVHKYRKYGKPFFPLRFLNLLPLSHMFGQAMATFIPPMLPGVVIFMRGYNPNEIVRQIKSRRVSVLVSVPKILDVLREHLRHRYPELATLAPEPQHWVMRWWRYHRVHSLFGWKFWAFVVGAAPLDSELEEFWRTLGFVVIQGYGLTETAPIVTLNHPFRVAKGTVGTPIGGVEVKIAADGEILVRGENVTSGYYEAAQETAQAFEDGWFHTGDIGALDDQGRLLVLGRKKEMIVTPEGLNVFPEDVERALHGLAGVRDAAVVGVTRGGEERVHAALVLDSGADPNEILRQANARLQDHQKIRGIAIWPGDELPRTEGTRKLKRRQIKQWVESGATIPAAAVTAKDASLESILAQFAGHRPVGAATTIDELGLTSLERLELMMALEERFQTTIDEARFGSARSVGDLRSLVEPSPTVERAPAEPVRFPAWNRSVLAQAIRRICLPTWILPLARAFAWLEVKGLAHLEGLDGPVVFACNHQSHMDTPVVLRALPARWRYRVAPAMAKEFFKAHFFPDEHTRVQWCTNSINYVLAALFFNAFPLPQREAGTRQTLRYIGDLLADGFSILIFPEGRRSETGDIVPFRAGIGMIGARLKVPVVPVRISGLDRVLHPTWRMARPGRVRVAFGSPLTLEGDDYAALAKRVEEAVKSL